jgi:hypothetical protein
MHASPESKLVLIKVTHTIIWVIFVSIIVFVLWSGLTAQVTIYSWLAVASVIIEGLVLAIFKGRCPLTMIAMKYSSSDKDNFDIYLPNWLAKYNKLIFTSIFLIGLTLMLLSYFSGK